jgi:hypothetical protein
VAGKAVNSIGSALQAASTLPQPVRATVAAAARHAFVRGSDAASLVAVGVAAAGAAVALRFLPHGMRVGATAPAPTTIGEETVAAAALVD